MNKSTALKWSQISGPEGLDLMRRFFADDEIAVSDFASIVAAVKAGDFDDCLAGKPDSSVHVTTSCHLMVLAMLNRLSGLTATEFYKEDALRYVRMNCLVQRMLGLQRLTLGWPVYAFGAEILGQSMIYTESQAPGSDPGEPMLNLDNWRDLPEYDAQHPVACVVRDNLLHMGRLSGIEPVAHMPAPYSLAAEIFGQEALIIALVEAPLLVHQILDLIVARVLVPWCDDVVASVPDVWVGIVRCQRITHVHGAGKLYEIFRRTGAPAYRGQPLG